MEYELIKIESLSGSKASVYTVLISDEHKSLFDVFLDENKNLFLDELKDIAQRLKVIGHKTGAREHFFKLKEGIPGDGVCALFDKPDKNLRLYCIRYGSLIVILGGGGEKPKNIRTLQESEKLRDENYFLRKVSKDIQERMKNKEIWFSEDDMNFEGNLIFNAEDYE